MDGSGFSDEQRKYLLNFLRKALQDLPSNTYGLQSRVAEPSRISAQKRYPYPTYVKEEKDHPRLIDFPKVMICISKAVIPLPVAKLAPYFSLELQFSGEMETRAGATAEVPKDFGRCLMDMLKTVGESAGLEFHCDLNQGLFTLASSTGARRRWPQSGQEERYPGGGRCITIDVEDRACVLEALTREINLLEQNLAEQPPPPEFRGRRI